MAKRERGGFSYTKSHKITLAAQSEMSATDMLGLVCHRSMSETVDLLPHYTQGCRQAVITGVGNRPRMFVCGDNTTPISNDGVA